MTTTVESTTDVRPRGRAAKSAAELRDEELLEQFLDHDDEHAFGELLGRYEHELYNYLARYTRDPGLAEDLVQATFLHVYQHAGQFERGHRVRPWLYSIATHLAIDTFRRAKRERVYILDTDRIDARRVGRLIEAGPSPSAKAEEHERAQWVREAVDQLPERLRTALLLVYFQGLKYSEAAETLGITVAGLKSRLRVAVRRLTTAWKRNHAVEAERIPFQAGKYPVPKNRTSSVVIAADDPADRGTLRPSSKLVHRVLRRIRDGVRKSR